MFPCRKRKLLPFILGFLFFMMTFYSFLFLKVFIPKVPRIDGTDVNEAFNDRSKLSEPAYNSVLQNAERAKTLNGLSLLINNDSPLQNKGYKVSNDDVKERDLHHDSPLPNKQSCVAPNLNPFEGDLVKYFHDVDAVRCSEGEDWVQANKGILSISEQIQKKHANVSCDITFLHRKTDTVTDNGESVTLQTSQNLNMTQDFFKAKCRAKDDSTYENIHAEVAFRPELHQRMRKTTNGLGLDVLMIGFDSLSHMTYMRKLKKTFNFFTSKLNGIVLDGYNIVGDGTPHALIPILTGKKESELPRTLKRLKQREPVDVYPMIWKDFRRHGYITAWAEDCPDMGTFSYRMIGFKEQPTDHYMRPFYIEAQKQYKRHKKLCLGSKRRTRVFLDWMKNLYVTYKNNAKFIFGFHSEVSHGDNNLVQTADDDITDTLRYLSEGGYLNNTLLILMSDHGARFSKMRATLQGKQEERLPFFAFALPEWFKKKYPVAFTNLKTNVGRLTTPFDIHPTFHDLLNFTGNGIGDIKQRGISLFKEIPKSRTCADAGIEPHWCACLNWRKVSVSDDKIVKAGECSIKYINQLLKPEEKLCATLSLKNISRSLEFLPEDRMLKFRKTKSDESFAADLTDNTPLDTVLYQIWIHTTPGDGYFESTVKYSRSTDTYQTSKDMISRINKYGNDPKCIYDSHEELRKYCYCKEN